MNWLNQIFEHYPNLRYAFLLLAFAVIFVILFLIYNFISKKLQRRAEKTQSPIDDFIMAIGDDTTDEDMFRALPPDGISIKVGSFSPTAKYRIPLQSKVLPFLKKLIS